MNVRISLGRRWYFCIDISTRIQIYVASLRPCKLFGFTLGYEPVRHEGYGGHLLIGGKFGSSVEGGGFREMRLPLVSPERRYQIATERYARWVTSK